jgi:hypothetical protein
MEHPSDYSESAEYTEYMRQIEAAYNDNETAVDKIAALRAIQHDIEEFCSTLPFENNPLYRHEHELRYSSEEHNTTYHYDDGELHILESYINYYLYKVYHPDWEPDPISPEIID